MKHVGFGLHNLTYTPLPYLQEAQQLALPRRKPFFLTYQPSLLGKSKSLCHRGTNHNTTKKLMSRRSLMIIMEVVCSAMQRKSDMGSLMAGRCADLPHIRSTRTAHLLHVSTCSYSIERSQ